MKPIHFNKPFIIGRKLACIADAFVLRGGVPVHYAGVPCEMDHIMAIARQHNLLVVEDAAQALLST